MSLIVMMLLIMNEIYWFIILKDCKKSVTQIYSFVNNFYQGKYIEIHYRYPIKNTLRHSGYLYKKNMRRINFFSEILPEYYSIIIINMISINLFTK